jgi:SHS2 domain-containing protein
VTGYRVFDHTADVGIEVWAPDVAGLLENAARGMYAVMADLSEVRSLESREVRLAAGGVEELLIAWLLELLFLTETEGVVFSRFEVDATETELRGVAWGESFDAERHPTGAVVKAVTRHQLSVKHDASGWKARVIFDI